MDSIVELVKRNEQLLLENAEALNDEEVEQEDIDEYLKIQGATKEELSAFENQFQIRLPEDFKTVYSYKNGSGYMSLIWPQEGFYRGYRLLSLKEIIKLKSLFQNKNCKMTEFPNVIGEKQLQQLDERIKPYRRDALQLLSPWAGGAAARESAGLSASHALHTGNLCPDSPCLFAAR